MLDRGKTIVLCLSALVVFYIVCGGFLGRVVARDDTYKNLSIFNDTLKKIQDEYVEKPSPAKLTTGCLKGLAEGVDFYSCYLTPEEYRFIQTQGKNSAGVGIILSPRIGYYRILQVLPGSPAERADVFPGDIIEEIDGRGISEKGYPHVLAMLAGPADSKVKLGIIRGRDEELREITITREEIKPAELETKILQDGTGYLRLLEIHDQSPANVTKALNTLINSEVKELVLDLRDSGNGSMDAAIQIADMFLDKGVITTLKGQTVPDKSFEATADNTLFSGPLVVLINGFTSGPAEIIAAAIQDNGRGKLVGLKTYGTASVQKYFPLEDGAAIYLTNLRYYTPSGRSFINSKYNLAGVKPDIKSPPEDFALSQYIDYEMATGKESQVFYKKYIESVYQKQMEKALELLKELRTSVRLAA